MSEIVCDRYYAIHTAKDAKYLMQSLHLSALDEVPDNAIEIYGHIQIVDDELKKDAKECGMSVKDYAMGIKLKRREILLERANIFDVTHNTEWVVLHATHEGMTFTIHRCLESVLRNLLEGECDMYSDKRGRNRIIREDGVYILYRMSELGYARYRQLRTEKKYSDPDMQHRYIIEYMFSSKDYLLNAGDKWYASGGNHIRKEPQ